MSVIRSTALKPILLFCTLLAMCQARSAEASPACQDLGGAVIFKDAMYGMLLGATGTGLYMVAADKTQYAGRQVAVGALAGLGFGGLVGVLETSFRRCSPSLGIASEEAEVRQPMRLGWQMPQLVSQVHPFHGNLGLGFALSYHWR
jgi:hypothetical protein